MPEQRTPAAVPLSLLRGGGHDRKNITTHWQPSPIPAAELISSFKQACENPQNQNQSPHTFSKIVEEKPWKLNVQNIHCCFRIHQGFKHFSSHITIFPFLRSIFPNKKNPDFVWKLEWGRVSFISEERAQYRAFFFLAARGKSQRSLCVYTATAQDWHFYFLIFVESSQIIQCRWIVSIK